MATTAVKKKTGSMKVQHVVSRVLIYALLIIVAALMLVPFLWMLSASFKMNKDVFTFPIEWIPSNPRPQNYIDIWTKIPLLTFVKNTAFLTIVVTILQVLTSSFAAYAFAKLNFKGKNVLFTLVLVQMMMPSQIFVIPQYQMLAKVSLTESIFALIFPGLVSAFGTFFLRQAYMGIPNEIGEAAYLDGCNQWQTFTKVMLPLTGTSVAALTIFTAVFAYADLMWPLVVNTDINLMTLSSGLATLKGQFMTNYPVLMAGSLFAMIPMLILYLIFQRQFIEGIALTGGK